MKTILFTTAALLFAAPAFAADLPRAAEPMAPAYIAPVGFDWTGFYVGANVGYGFSGDFNDNASLGINSADGFTGGVQAGYNYQFNPLVVGIEGEIDYADISDRFEGDKGTLNWRGSLTPRLGFAIDRFMPYVKAGLAFGSVEINTGDKDSNVLYGWTAGIGAEYAVTNNISVRAEYNYTDLATDTFTTDEVGDFKAGYKGSDVKLGVNYKF